MPLSIVKSDLRQSTIHLQCGWIFFRDGVGRWAVAGHWGILRGAGNRIKIHLVYRPLTVNVCVWGGGGEEAEGGVHKALFLPTIPTVLFSACD